MPIDQSAVASVLGIETEFEDLREGSILFLPQRIAVIAQGATASTYPTDKFQATSAGQVGTALGFGSPAHLIARQLFPVSLDGVGTIPVTIYPLLDDGSGVAAAGDITVTGTEDGQTTYRVIINNIPSEQFVVADGADNLAWVTAAVTAINATLEMPVIAADATLGVMDLTAKWAGETGNDIFVEVEGEDSGFTFTITQPTGGAANPDIQPALDQVGDVWETMVLNSMNFDDEVTLDKLKVFGEGRWGQLTRKPLVAFVGNTSVTPAAAIAVTDTRKDDRVNSQLVAPGSNDLPFVVAARQLSRIAPVANNNPPKAYVAQRATGLTPGSDGDQWDFAQRDQAIKGGSSTVTATDGVVELGDIVTMWHPDDEPIPAYQYVANIVKLMNTIFNLNLIFGAEEWAAAPLIPDDQPTVNEDARKPKHAKADVAGMIDSLAENALISDADFAKNNTTAVINAQNPNRLDVKTTVKLSGNTRQKSVTLQFGFFFGTAAVVA